jgi:protein-S-isoprenylcysteine O-methyltransferase Ste14
VSLQRGMPRQSKRDTMIGVIARMRVALGFISGVLVLILARPTGRSLLIGMSIAALGELLRIWAAGHLHKAREVTASGPYRFLPHPLYVGSSVMGLGLAIASNSIPVAVLIAIYLVTTLTAAIKSEEAFLRRTFGEQYDLYRSGIAAKRRDPGAARRRFSLAQAMANREYRAVAGFVVALLLLIWKAAYNGSFWQTAGT